MDLWRWGKNLQRDNKVSRAENKALRKENKSLWGGNKALRGENKAFRMGNQLIRGENQSLRQGNQLLCTFKSVILENQKPPGGKSQHLGKNVEHRK